MTATQQNSLSGFDKLWDRHSATKTERLRKLQQQAFGEFTGQGFPTTRLENWKYTDLRKLAAIYPEWLANVPAAESPNHAPLLDLPDAIHLAFVDGQFRPDQSSDDLPAGLLVGSLDELAARQPELMTTQWGKLLEASKSSIVALNAAFTESLVALIMPANTRLDRPLYVSHYSSTDKTVSHPRLLASLAPNSEATIIEHFSGSAAAIINSVSEFRCDDGAKLNYYKLQEEHPGSWHLAQQSVHLGRGSSARTTTVDCGSQLARNELTVNLAGDGANLNAGGLLLADQRRHIDSRINVEHSAPNTQSRERYRAILADQARGVFNGRILVKQNAQKTAAELTNRNLLLNKGAEIDTKPELEIYADDVKCAHGSTTGQLDQNSMFYLLTRGIDKHDARNLLVRAFAAELLADIAIPAIAERTQHALQGLKFGDT